MDTHARAPRPDVRWYPPHDNFEDRTPIRRLAAELVAGCVEVLRVPRPRSRQAIREWEIARATELAFITNPKVSAIWCEAAGVDWDVVISKLNAEHVLDHPLSAREAA